jgi:hypothetical protein
LCEPLEVTANAQRLVVEDSAACQKTLISPTTSSKLVWDNGVKWKSVSDLNEFDEFTNFTATGTTTGRNLVTRFSEEVNVKDFGAIGDGVADDTAALQNAINAAQTNGRSVYLPVGRYKLTSTINITAGMRLRGEFPVVNDYPNSSLTPPTKGTWLYFSHNGIGINVTANNNVVIESIGTFRPTQTLPVSGLAATYTPIAQGADIKVTFCNDYFFARNLLLLNPYIGIEHLGTGGSFIEYILMNPIKIGISIDQSYDTTYINNIHIWPFWTGPIPHTLWTWTVNNTTGIILGRCDNPMLSNIFTLLCKIGLELRQTSSGSPTRIKAINLEFDTGGSGIYVSGANINGHFQNTVIQGATSTPTTPNINGIIIDGANSRLVFDGLEIAQSGEYGINATTNATSGELYADNIRIETYGVVVPSSPAIFAANSNFKVYLDGSPSILSGGGASYNATLEGMGWRWSDVTASRSIGTVYTNSKNRPMALNVFGQNTSGSSAGALLYIDGQQVQCFTVGNNEFCSFFYIVPPQSTYQITNLNTISKWTES